MPSAPLRGAVQRAIEPSRRSASSRHPGPSVPQRRVSRACSSARPRIASRCPRGCSPIAIAARPTARSSTASAPRSGLRQLADRLGQGDDARAGGAALVIAIVALVWRAASLSAIAIVPAPRASRGDDGASCGQRLRSRLRDVHQLHTSSTPATRAVHQPQVARTFSPRPSSTTASAAPAIPIAAKIDLVAEPVHQLRRGLEVLEPELELARRARRA